MDILGVLVVWDCWKGEEVNVLWRGCAIDWRDRDFNA